MKHHHRYPHPRSCRCDALPSFTAQTCPSSCPSADKKVAGCRLEEDRSFLLDLLQQP
jgi:hypothetical protein